MCRGDHAWRRSRSSAGPTKPADVLVFLLLLPLWTYIASLLRLYHLAERSFDSSWVDEIAPIVLAATAWSWILLLARAAFESGPVAVLPSIAVWLTMIVTITTFRSVARLFARRRSWYRQGVVIVGVPPDVSRVARRIRRHPEYGLDVMRRVEIDRRRIDREVETDRRADGTEDPPIVDSPQMLERVGIRHGRQGYAFHRSYRGWAGGACRDRDLRGSKPSDHRGFRGRSGGAQPLGAAAGGAGRPRGPRVRRVRLLLDWLVVPLPRRPPRAVDPSGSRK